MSAKMVVVVGGGDVLFLVKVWDRANGKKKFKYLRNLLRAFNDRAYSSSCGGREEEEASRARLLGGLLRETHTH